jgi:hypothetical protein
MSVKAIVLSSCALFALGITSAGAGQCTTEIQNMAQLFASSDAGSGPTGQVAGSQHPPTAAMTQADRSTAASSTAAGADKEQHPPTATMNTQTTGSASPGGSASGGSAAPGASAAQGQHPPTTAMNQATGGSAASPQDVQRQTQGAPTASSQAQGASAGTDSKAAAMTALDQARALDREGKEAECMAAIRQAHGHMAR